MSQRLLIRSILIAMFATLASPAAAAPDRSIFAIGGSVATICRIDFERPPFASKAMPAIDLGGYTLLCNSAAGFRIIVKHPPGLVNAVIEIDGVAVPLASGTETPILVSQAPSFHSGSARLMLGDATPPPAGITFRVEPLGIVYR